MYNERYASEKYVYGTRPNEYFKMQLDELPVGKLLLPAEGEGRNAVYASSLGWEVDAFDASVEGKKKAIKLAQNRQVNINYEVINFDEIDLPEAAYDVIGLFYVHVPLHKRELYHRKLIKALKPGGHLIVEGFSKQQINNTTGGPKNIDMLFSKQELASDFAQLSTLNIEEQQITLDEGDFHDGDAHVIRLLGTR